MDKHRSRTIFNGMLLLIFLPCFYVIGSKKPFIYILTWHTMALFEPTPGTQYFVNQNCSFQNCFLTRNRSFFNDIRDFDVILFTAFQVFTYTASSNIPHARSPEQKYIFMSSEPPTRYPVSSVYDGFFNYTFTYKLDSDVTYRFVVVRSKTDNIVIAPTTKHNKWINTNDMEPVSEEIQQKLQNKNKAVLWLVSHCITPNSREDFVLKLRSELESYNLGIDITGRWQCVDSYLNQTCPCHYWYKTSGKYSEEVCFRWISENHYFYLAFENSMCEDYITEKIVTATKSFAVPVVLGGADYSRFLPPGSYIHANDLEPKDLASMMNDLIHDRNRYYEYFKWHRYYSIHHHAESPETDQICGLCAFLNSKKYEATSSVYTRITWFWAT